MKPVRFALSPTRHRPLNLLLGAMLLLIATLLLLALATWRVTDPSWDTSAPTTISSARLVQNWIGPVGAWASDLLLQFLGITAFALPLWIGGLGLRWMRARSGGPAWLRWMGIILTLVFLPTSLGIIPFHWRWLHILPIEGVSGRLAADALVAWLNLRGAAIVAGVMAAAGLYFGSAFSFRRAWEGLQQQFVMASALLDRWHNWRLDRADRKAERLAMSHDFGPVQSDQPEPAWETQKPIRNNWFVRLFRRNRNADDLLDEVPAVQRIASLAARREADSERTESNRRRSIWERTDDLPLATPPLPVALGPESSRIVPIAGRADTSQPDHSTSQQPAATIVPLPQPAPTPATTAATRAREAAVQTAAVQPNATPTAAQKSAASAAIHERADADLRTTTIAPKNVSGFKLPPSTLLNKGEEPLAIRENELREEARKLVEKCAEFKVNGQIVQINPGPMVTTYEFKPDASVKYSRVAGLGDDLCLAMRAESILIERMAGKSTIGIQVPNHERETIHLRDVIESETFTKAKSRLTLAMGKDINGRIVTADLASMPHVLIAGSTGSGKSVAINAMIMSLLFRTTPAQVRLILVDPKRVELGMYEGIPHLFTPIITEAKLAANALRNAVREMERRLKLLASRSVRNIDQYNAKISEISMSSLFTETSEEEAPLPYIVIIIDELADLMMLDRANVEESITRLAQMARAVGIHLILATQRPSVDVITGLIKANVPTRISFRLASKVDSRTIIDDNGAESLLGRGDMLFRPPGTSRLMRIHAPYVSEKETAAIVDFWKAQGEAEYVEGFLEAPRDERAKQDGESDSEEDNDPLYDDAVRLVFEFGKASTSLLQRRLRIGYGRAAHLIDLMERDGLVGPADGSRPRELLKSPGWLHEVPTAID
uniref:DNA translocase FtsK n=1 Tax=mine drainage metagenome TaxID=410659 RepID=E6QIA7_9ZZZZ